MIYAVEVQPKNGMKYLACVTERKYLAEFVVGLHTENLMRARLKKVKLEYPIQIHEIDRKFIFAKKVRKVKSRPNIVYHLEKDFFPEQVLNDEMGVLDHDHYGEELEGLD